MSSTVKTEVKKSVLDASEKQNNEILKNMGHFMDGADFFKAKRSIL
jgi:hypothetical protein